jgi:hypothetical protein
MSAGVNRLSARVSGVFAGGAYSHAFSASTA